MSFPRSGRSTRVRRTRRFASLALVTLIGAACSAGAASSAGTGGPQSPRPSSPAKVTIVSPTDGQVIHGTTVHVAVELSGAKIVRATSTDIVPTEGHLHVYLDGQIVAMNFGLTDDIANVMPGIHVLEVEFVASDHLPFDPRVIQQTTFEAKR